MEPPPSERVSPPEDPEDWSDEEWIEFLEATDDESTSEHESEEKRRPRHPGGVLGAAMLGLRDAIYGPPDDEAAVVVEAPGAPPGDDRPEVHLDLEHPERSTVIVHTERNLPPRRAISAGEADEVDPGGDQISLR